MFFGREAFFQFALKGSVFLYCWKPDIRPAILNYVCRAMNRTEHHSVYLLPAEKRRHDSPTSRLAATNFSDHLFFSFLDSISSTAILCPSP